MKDTARNTLWTRSTASRGSDVELYLTARDAGEDLRGLGHTTVGKVAFFFGHEGNPWRRGESSVTPRGEFTVWVAVSEYVTAGVGASRKVDHATGLDEFKMWRALTFYPASAIRCVVHMMHACHTSGASACGVLHDRRKRPKLRCKILGNASYVLNKYFHNPLSDVVD